MALLHCQIFSEVLGFSTEITVVLPQPTAGQIGVHGTVGSHGPWPTLWLLHGLSDNHSTWTRRTSIERYVAPLGLALVMPSVHRSFYADMAHGPRYFTYVTEELPRIAQSFFPLSEKREHNYVAGLSMGGYGAFKAALSCPDRYAAGASLSGALNRFAPTDHPIDIEPDLKLAFGDDVSAAVGTRNDLMHLASELKDSGQDPPALYQCCGTADFLYDQNQSFLEHARSIGLGVFYEEHEGEEHEWSYWDRQIQRVLDWLPLPGREASVG